MDPTALVTDSLRDGRTLLRRLLGHGFEVTAAAWLKTTDDQQWRLYLVAPLAETLGIAAAYRAIYDVVESVGTPSISLFDVKLFAPSEPIARDLIRAQQSLPAGVTGKLVDQSFGDLEVDEAYIYSVPALRAPLPKLVQRFRYTRSESPNLWYSRVVPGPLEILADSEIDGAISYTTSRWEGETPDDQKSATVTVLTELDPRVANPQALADPALLGLLTMQARRDADGLFLSRHPDFVVESDD